MSNNTETIVLVDDYPDNLLVMKQILLNAFPNIQVKTFGSSLNVMEYMLNNTVVLAILDVQMPTINGLDLCRMLKDNEITKNIPILLITSHSSSPEFKAESLDIGATDFINRPINNDEFIARINVALRTSRKEKSLKDQAQQVAQNYKMLFSKMLSGFAINQMNYDKDSNPIHSTFLNVNPAFEKLINIKADFIIGRNSSEILNIFDTEYLKKFDEVIKTGKPSKFEIYLPDIDKYFDVSAFKTGDKLFATIISDISKRKNAEKTQLRLMTAIEQLTEIVMITDPDGTVEYINPAFEKITGYTYDEIIGKTPRILKSNEQDEAFYEELWETITSGNKWQGQFINIKKDGSTYVDESIISPVHDQDGKITHYVAIKKDVTDDLSKEEQLRQAQKMESVGKLAGGVAHDFNNLLMAIMGYVDLCLDELEPEHSVINLLKEINSAAERSVTITKQLLAFARKQTIKPEIINLNDQISNMLPLLRKMIGENIEIKWLPFKTINLIKVDSGQVDQILTNLLVNARDAISGSGTVVVETQNVDVDLDLYDRYKDKHEGIKPGQYVLLNVSDNGKGMDKNTLKNIFDPFFTTKNIGEGTGLGLSTVYGIVQQNHGFINVYSETGIGTTFRIYFPCCEKQTSSTIKTTDTQPILKGDETILLVEDEETIRHITRKFLEKQGYNVISAEDPNEAIHKVQEYPGKIDMMISDIVMPVMNGPQLGKILTKMRPRIKTLFMSGYTENIVNQQENIEDNFNFLPKPFSRKTLAFKIRNILDNK